jgi:2-amino-4-hydroxy-6-hydroxymethyldihydropteridine diphosphokinase
LYESPAEGFKGNDFYNIGVNATTDKSSHEVKSTLKEIENALGRDRELPKFSARIIDLDLVLYNEVVDTALNLPRSDVLKCAYFLAPLAELSAIKKHPIEKQTYQKLWQAFQSRKDFVLNQYNIEKLFK